jgi:cell division protein FtsB
MEEIPRVGGDPVKPEGPETRTVGKLKAVPRPKLLAAFVIFLGAALVLLSFFSHKGLYQSFHLRQERLRLEQENARLAEENARLARTIDRLHHDPEMIQDLIRRELNFIRKNETILQLPAAREEPAAPESRNPAPPPPAEAARGAECKGQAPPGSPEQASGQGARRGQTSSP